MEAVNIEAQSIITQVSRDDLHNAAASPQPALPPDKAVKKKKSRSVLDKFFCCFRPRATIHQHTPLSTEDEHHAKKSEAQYLLPKRDSKDVCKKCVVIDLDETLVHSSFQPINNADFIIPVEIDGTVHQVYVLKRPYVDEFLQKMGELFECVLFTASLGKYADPVTDLLDKWGVFKSRLFRDACVYHRGNYVKDLSRLGRDLNQVIIVDNSPASYMFHPRHAVPVVSWFDDASDRELLDLIPFFQKLAATEDIFSYILNASLPLGTVSNLQRNSSSGLAPGTNNMLSASGSQRDDSNIAP